MTTIDVPTSEFAGLRLVPFRESGDYIGVKSPTTLYKMVSNGELPEPIKRGTRSFFLERDLQSYIAKLDARRNSRGQGSEQEVGKQVADRMQAGKLFKRAEWRKTVRS